MKFMALMAICLFGFGAVALGASPDRIRGTVAQANATSMTVTSRSGASETVALTKETHYVTATAATRADVRPGSYIGTATKTVGGRQVALEVTIFPASMKGAGEGHYPWDDIPDTTMAGAGPVASGMTNGSVSAANPGKTTHSNMTNGSVASSANLTSAVTAAGDKEISVAYKGGSQTVLLPATAPINLISPADRSALAPGAMVFVVAVPGSHGLQAAYVVIATHGAKLGM